MNSFRLKSAVRLSQLSQAGKTIRQIAAAMDRTPSTIMRELKRNTGAQVGYQPAYADKQAKSRRWKGSRLLRNTDLQSLVLNRLSQGWSPAQVAGRLKKRNDARSSATSRSTGSSMPRSGAPRTTVGDTTCPEAKASAAGGDTKGAVRWITSPAGYPLINARPTSINAVSRVTGKPI